MAQPARVVDQHAPSPSPTPREEAPWSGDLHGSVGEMHRAIEERLAGPERMVVLPLPTRPVETLVATMSRLAGWAALGGGVAGAFLLLR